MPGHPRLYRRGATYYHRAAIPIDIRESYPKSEETFSLRTKDYQEAIRRVRVEAARVDRLFAEHRKKLALDSKPALAELSDEHLKQIEDLYYAFRLEEDEETRLAGFDDPEEQRPADPIPTFEEHTELVETMDDANRYNFARGKVDAFFLAEAEEVLGWDGVNLRLDPTSPSWKKLALRLQAASIRAVEAVRERNKGNVIETPRTAGVDVRSSAPKLSDAVREWINEKARNRWVEKTKRDHQVWMGHFITVAGDRSLDSYAKADARAFKSVLMKLPANWNKHRALKGLPVDTAANKAVELGMKPMSDNNMNKILSFVGSFWNWADENYDDTPPNPFRGIKIKTRRNVREERDPFDIAELIKIFNAPLYTGCRSLHYWKQPGDLIPRQSGYFWVPLIALFTGARLGEIIQLYTHDVREEAGIKYFDINKNEEDKRLKNPNSKRFTPIHPTLAEIGLLDLVQDRVRAREKRLFPELRMGADGYYSSPFSKYYRRFLESIGVKRRKNAFHSFRHSFEDACRDSGVSKEVMEALQGHGENGMAARYGRGYSLKTLASAMHTIRYDGLDLSHLFPTAVPGNSAEKM